MLISGTVNITMSGGAAPFGDSGSSILFMSPAMVVQADPTQQSSGQVSVGGGMSTSFGARVIHSGEVSINDPNAPSTASMSMPPVPTSIPFFEPPPP